MFKALFGSLVGKLTSLALLVAGLTGGMAATGELPGLNLVSSDQPAEAAGQTSGTIALDFPDSVLTKVAAPAASIAPVQEVIVEEAPIVVVSAPAPAVAPQCVGQLQGLVTGLVNGVQAITSPEQAQAMLAQAGAAGEATKGCAAEATAAGNLGLGELGKVTEQLVAVVGQIQALPILAGVTPAPGAGIAANPVGAVTGLVTKGLETTLKGVNKVTGVVGEGLGLILN